MLAFKTLIRIIIVGLCWSLFFFEGIRVILLTNWHFDLIDGRHWKYVWNLWMSGWVIDDTHEWAFIFIILSFIPLWLCGWASLSMIEWEKWLQKLWQYAKHFYDNVLTDNAEQARKKEIVPQKPVLKRKKSYKETRPRNLSSAVSPLSEETRTTSPIAANRTLPNVKPILPTAPVAAENSVLNHSLFKLDDEEDDFELNFDDLDKIGQEPIQKKTETKTQERQDYNQDHNKKDNNRQRNNNKDNKDNNRRNNNKPIPMANQPQTPKNVGNSSLEIIKQKGYQVITSATIKNNFVDFIGVADGQICICLVDKEPGDWLADEERFNDEEPLWFSENSHRISPVRCADIVQEFLTEKLRENNIDFAVSTYVIIQYGNIINAEDMFDTWRDLNINVTRIDRGMPRELKLFAKTLEDADNKIDIERFEKIKKLVRNLT